MKKSLLYSIAITILMPPPGLCDDSVSALDEVVVTAQRKEENLQQVPLSINAISSSDLENHNTRNATGLAEMVPGLQTTNPAGWRPIFSLRGISMADYSSNQSSPVGVYSDETYLGAVTTHGLAFFDLDRVEVLKGPQGTLYGRNTTGGAINLISRSPDLDEAGESMVRLGYGNYNEKRIFAAAESPLLPGRLAARAAFDFDLDDGWWKNHNGPNMAQANRVAGRLTLNGQITDELNALLKLTIAQNSPRFNPARTIGAVQVPGGNLFNYGGYTRDPSYGIREGAINRVGRTASDLNLVSLKLTYDPGSVKFVSVSSWYENQVKFNQDNDASPVSVLEIDWFSQHNAFSEDMRMESDWEGPFSIIGGVYISRDENKMNNFYHAFGDPPWLIGKSNPALFNLMSKYGIVDQQMAISSVSTAAYTQGRYQFTDRLGMDMGVRFTVDQNDLDYLNISRLDHNRSPLGSWVPGNNSINAPFIPPSAGNPGAFLNGPYTTDSASRREQQDQNWTGKIGMDYALTPDMMLYGHYSRGYRSGNYNPGLVYSMQNVEKRGYTSPETVDAFEVGVKSDWLDNRLRLNMAGYYYLYENQQIMNVVGGSSELQNAGQSHIQGIENSLLAIPLEGLRITFGTNVMDAVYDDLKLANTATPDPNDQISLAGNQLIAAPKFKLAGAIDYSFEPGFGGMIDLGVNGSYQTHQWYSAYNDKPGYEQIGQQPYGLMNAHIAFSDTKGRYTLALHSENLLDEDYDVYAVNLASGFGYNGFIPGPPRRYGLDLSVRF